MERAVEDVLVGHLVRAYSPSSYATRRARGEVDATRMRNDVATALLGEWAPSPVEDLLEAVAATADWDAVLARVDDRMGYAGTGA